MPKMWFARDGKRPETQSGSAIEISFAEAEIIASNGEIKFVGAEAPSINPDQPSESLKNVVIEVESEEGSHPSFLKTGFYLIAGVKPKVAESKLNEMRS